VSKIDHSLFSANEHALQQAFGVCPQCQATLKVRHGKSGAFVGCSQYPECDFTKPLHENETSEIKRIEGSHCPQCSSQLCIKKGRYGLFIGCSHFPECHYIESAKQQDALNVDCPACKQGHLLKRATKFGKNFYPCDNYPKCKYALNMAPVAFTCPECEWPVMQQKGTAEGLIWQCPQKHCNHKMTPL
jgi:putative DNA topoisomerase